MQGYTGYRQSQGHIPENGQKPNRFDRFSFRVAAGVDSLVAVFIINPAKETQGSNSGVGDKGSAGNDKPGSIPLCTVASINYRSGQT